MKEAEKECGCVACDLKRAVFDEQGAFREGAVSSMIIVLGGAMALFSVPESVIVLQALMNERQDVINKQALASGANLAAMPAEGHA